MTTQPLTENQMEHVKRNLVDYFEHCISDAVKLIDTLEIIAKEDDEEVIRNEAAKFVEHHRASLLVYHQIIISIRSGALNPVFGF